MNPTRWISGYTMVTAESLHALEEAVERYIEQSWQPYGQPFRTEAKAIGAHQWTQVMVTYST